MSWSGKGEIVDYLNSEGGRELVHVCSNCNPNETQFKWLTKSGETDWCRKCDHRSSGHLSEVSHTNLYKWDFDNGLSDKWNWVEGKLDLT